MKISNLCIVKSSDRLWLLLSTQLWPLIPIFPQLLTIFLFFFLLRPVLLNSRVLFVFSRYLHFLMHNVFQIFPKTFLFFHHLHFEMCILVKLKIQLRVSYFLTFLQFFEIYFCWDFLILVLIMYSHRWDQNLIQVLNI